MAKKKGDRKLLTPVDKEVIFQTFIVLQNKTQTAKRCGVSLGSVNRVIKELTARDVEVAGLPATRETRAEAAAKLASRFHVKVGELMDSITPEMLEHGKIPLNDKDGNLIRYYEYGPSLLQTATAVGIITDKANVAQVFEQKMMQDVQDGKLMLPSDIDGLISAVHGKIRSLKMLDVRFEEDNPDVITNATEIMAEVQAVEAKRPEVVSFDEFDNPT